MTEMLTNYTETLVDDPRAQMLGPVAVTCVYKTGCSQPIGVCKTTCAGEFTPTPEIPVAQLDEEGTRVTPGAEEGTRVTALDESMQVAEIPVQVVVPERLAAVAGSGTLTLQ